RTVSSSLSVAQRLIQVLDHLGLPRAHFGLRHPVELIALLEHAPERVASVVLQGATGRPEPFAPVAAHTLWVLGDAGPSGHRHARLTALLDPGVHRITNYADFLWSDPAGHHPEELASALLRFLQRMDAERALPPVSVSGTGEVAGITYTAAGSGTPVVL